MKFLLLVFFTSSLLSESMQYKDYDFNSTKREYLVYEPENFHKDSTKKLVIGFHGYSGTASAFEFEITGGLNLIAEKYNFLAVYPQGKYFFDLETYTSKTFISSWNDLTGSVTKTPNGETCDIDADIYPKYPDCPDTGRCSWQTCADDIGFINSLIDFLKEKFLSFGLAVEEVDGNSIKDLQKIFKKIPFENNKPNLIIANTTKGSEISFIENEISWHHKVPTDEEYRNAIKELDEKLINYE